MNVDDVLLGLIRALPAPCWVKDRERRMLYLNDQARAIFGVDVPALGRTVHELMGKEAAEEMDAADSRILESGEPSTVPLWLPRGGGGRVHIAVLKFPIETAEGRLIGGIGLDITSLSTASWDASTYRQILDAMSDMILVKGPRSKLRWANRAFLEAYGMTNEQLQGIVDAPFAEPDDTQQYVKDDELVFTSGRTLDIAEENMSRADGTSLLCHTRKSPIFDDAGKVLMTVGVMRDITEKKRLEVERRQAQKLEAIGRLASGMAHEINTPVQFIGDQARFAKGAFSDVLELVAHYQALFAKLEAGTATAADLAPVREAEANADLPYTQAHVVSAFDAILDGAQRVGRLVHAMKEFGHPDRGVKLPADINAALRNALIVTANEYKYVADTATELGDIPMTVCNISELNQVFLNLIINGAHAIADVATPERRGLIKVSTRLDGDDVVISIGDTGGGIPEAVQTRIFDPFFTTKEVGRGTGQGLAIARNIVVDRHHGALTFETASGKGTTFHVRLPLDHDVPPPS